MDNEVVAKIFDETSELLALAGGNPFRVRAYINAARTIRSLKFQIIDVVDDPTTKLSDLPNIGQDLEGKIRAIVRTGEFGVLEDLRTLVPVGVRQLLRVKGLGPKKVMRLYKELGIQSVADLRQAIADHRLEKVKGFSVKMSAKLLSNLDFVQAIGRRILISDALRLADGLTKGLKGVHGVARVAVAGSVRRCKDTIGDLDILAIAESRKLAMDALAKFDRVSKVDERGASRMSVRLDDGFQVDLRIVDEAAWGAALVYFTGSKEHNIELRRRARQRGLKINEYGVFSGDKYQCGATEEDVYRSLGLPWIPPELREMRSEFALADQNRLPDLVKLEDLKGDLHIHTNVTDGLDSLGLMVAEAVKRGYKYIAITDHSQRVKIAKGLDGKALRKHWAGIDAVQSLYPQIKILKGVELDILEDGSMDLADDVLRDADWVIAAIHYGQAQSVQDITRRLINAIRSPYVSAIAHPSGRLIGKRQGYDARYNDVFKAAADYGCALEINGQPWRQDLNGELLEQAAKFPVKFVLDSDAHSATELDFTKFAIFQARRGGLGPDRVLNAQSWSRVQKRH